MTPLHIFTGDAAAMTVGGALGIPEDQLLVQHDVIACGPVRAFISRGEWLATRDDFWQEVCGGPALEEFPEDLAVDAGEIGRTDRVTLWIGAGLSDRLLLATVLTLADLAGFDLPPIETMEISSHRTLSVPVLGWGMLRTNDVGRPKGRPVDNSQIIRARRAWAGLTAQTPASLLSCLDVIDDDPELAAAMFTLIGRYPDAVSGLSHWDAALLAAVSNAGSDAFTVIGGAIGANHHWLDPVGDSYLFWRLRRLADPTLSEPLLTLTGDSNTARACRVMPTAFGIEVRDGRANHVAVNGIDDWIGGVHLRQPKGSPWVRKGDELIRVSE
jgi:Domain of unknown function (DUF1835)